MGKHSHTHTSHTGSWILMRPSNVNFISLRYDYTFELYSESERLYLFGTSDPDSHKEWVKSIAKVAFHFTNIHLKFFAGATKDSQYAVPIG